MSLNFRKLNTKKIFAFIFMSCVASSAFADLGNGPYLGIGGDWTRTNFDFKLFNPLNNVTVTTSPSKDNFLGHGFLGYGSTFNSNYYLGLELGTYFPTIKGSTTRPGTVFADQVFTNNFQLKNLFTADFTPGVKFCNNILLYGRVGYSYAKAELDQSPTGTLPGFPSQDKNLSGVRLGASLDYPLTCHFSVGIDYIYTYFQKHTSKPGTLALSPDLEYSFRPTLQDVGAHLRFNF